MNEQNKNLLLATVLSLGVVLIWQIYFPVEPPAQNTPPPSEELAAPTPQPTTELATADQSNTSDIAALSNSPRIKIETPRLQGSLSLYGGRIDDLQLKDYTTTIDPASPIVTLLQPEGQSGAYYNTFGWAPGATLSADDVPGPKTLWQSDDTVLSPTTPVTMRWDNGRGQIFTRRVSIDDNYMFTIEQSVINEGENTVQLAPYGRIRRSGEPEDLKGFFILHEGMVRMSDGELDDDTYSTMEDYDLLPARGAHAEQIDDVQKGWIGFTDHYWMSVLIPQGVFDSISMYHARSGAFFTETLMSTQTIEAGQSAAVTTQFFAGAKEWSTIRAYQNNAGVDRFIDSIDWGWFYFLTKPIFIMLHWLNGFIGNMGWAIIGLTLVIKAILLPLAYKSYVSMARMKELQPEMEKMKESAGDDREKLQKGMMELYKKNKVNPASGCLPILLQIPIFFSLYKVIFVTIELRQAPWFGPFQDLSLPDPTSIYNFFGVLPWQAFAPGSILALIFIGILPLLLGVSMWMQQKLNPAPTDPTQAMIFAWMPWVFMFMLGSFASGLVVYWIANNTITFIQQYLIMRSQGVKPDVFGNILAGFKRSTPED